jgi:hypothetical protein
MTSGPQAVNGLLPTLALQDHVARKPKHLPPPQSSLIGFLTVGIRSLAALMSARPLTAFNLNSYSPRTNGIRPPERKVKTPAPRGMKAPLPDEGDASLFKPGSHLLFTFTLGTHR